MARKNKKVKSKKFKFWKFIQPNGTGAFTNAGVESISTSSAVRLAGSAKIARTMRPMPAPFVAAAIARHAAASTVSVFALFLDPPAPPAPPALRFLCADDGADDGRSDSDWLLPGIAQR